MISLAKSSLNIEEPRCRPTIIESDEAILDFEQLRHPSMALRRDFVANDVKLGGDDSQSTMLLTGPVSNKCLLCYLFKSN